MNGEIGTTTHFLAEMNYLQCPRRDVSFPGLLNCDFDIEVFKLFISHLFSKIGVGVRTYCTVCQILMEQKGAVRVENWEVGFPVFGAQWPREIVFSQFCDYLSMHTQKPDGCPRTMRILDFRNTTVQYFYVSRLDS